MKINRHILDNGLRLVHSRDESTQMVALNILYNVGARDEHPEHTGTEADWIKPNTPASHICLNT